jgi:hypothetical protein
LCLVIVFASCKKENAFDCFKSNGPETTETRYPGSFTAIELNDKIEVTVFKGAEYKVEVIAGRHIIKNISAQITDGILKIVNNNKCNFVRGYKRVIKINITVPYLYKITNNSVEDVIFDPEFSQDSIIVDAESSGDIHINGKYNYIQTSSNGNGDVYISGSCSTLFVFTNGTNYLWADGLSVSDYAYIETLSKGDCYFNASDLKKFGYSIQGDGNIYYEGNPGVISGTADNTGKGKVIKQD